MYLSSKYQFLFIHIEKAAGSSVRDSLSPYWDRPSITHKALKKLGLPHHRWRVRAKWPLHLHAKDAKMILPDALWNGCFMFTFVRNPWDREVSTFRFYKSLIRQFPDDPRAIAANRYEDFESWFYDWREKTPVIQQSDYLVDEDGYFIINFLGRFECIDEDWECIQSHIGKRVSLLRHNVVRPGGTEDKSGYQRHYNEALQAAVRRRYPLDCERLNYAFDNSAIPESYPGNNQRAVDE